MKSVAWLLIGVILSACGGIMGPELPESAAVAGVELTAELRVVQAQPTVVKVRVVARNTSGEAVQLGFLGSPCSVRPTIYVGEERVVLGPPGTNSCALISNTLVVPPGEEAAFPDEPEFGVEDRLGAAFRTGRYRIGALVEVGLVDEPPEMIELHAGDVDAR